MGCILIEGGWYTLKTFLLDTNVLLHDPSCLKVFGNNEVVISLSVLDELDNVKTRLDELGRNARAVVRVLDGLRAEGSLSEGVVYEKSLVRVELNHRNFVPEGLDPSKVDNRLISTAIGLKKEGKNVIIVSKDINLRVKCDAVGIVANDYNKDKIAEQPNTIYSGVQKINVPSITINELYGEKQITFRYIRGKSFI